METSIKIQWTTVALLDMNDAVAYIAKDSKVYAARFASQCEAAANAFREYPYKGRLVPELPRSGLRELIAAKYRIIYRVKTESIEIIALIHGARNLFGALEDRV